MTRTGGVPDEGHVGAQEARTGLHDEAEDTVAGTADGQAVQQLVAERLALSNRGETTVLNLLGVELERVFGELETLLHKGSKLTDAATLLTEDLLGVGSTDDDLQSRS